jgi:hypothetical protein
MNNCVLKERMVVKDRRLIITCIGTHTCLVSFEVIVEYHGLPHLLHTDVYLTPIEFLAVVF